MSALRGWAHQTSLFSDGGAPPPVRDLSSFVEHVRAMLAEAYAGRDVTVRDVDRLVTERAVPIPPVSGAFHVVLEGWDGATPSGRTLWCDQRGRYVEVYHVRGT